LTGGYDNFGIFIDLCTAQFFLTLLCGAYMHDASRPNVASVSPRRRFEGSAFSKTPQRKDLPMFANFDSLQKQGQESFDAAMKAATLVSKGFQDLASETADYSRKSFEATSAAAEKLMSTKSLEKAFEVQTDFAKASYEAFVAQANKVGAIYADIAKEAYKPFERSMPKSPTLPPGRS